MADGKRHKIKVDYSVTNPEGVETIGAALRIGEVKEDHLLIYEAVVKKHMDAAQAELMNLQKAGKFR